MNDPQTRYRAHPAFVLKAMDAGDPVVLQDEHLGLRWLKLPRDERARQEQVFFATLLRWLGGERGARFAATFDELRDAESFAHEWDVERDGYEVRGESSAELAEALTDVRISDARIHVDNDVPLLEIEKKWNGVSVWLIGDARRELTTELEAALARGSGTQTVSSEHPVRAGLFIAIANASWIVGALIGIAAMLLLERAGVPLLLAIAIGFAALAVLVLGPAAAVKKRVSKRLL